MLKLTKILSLAIICCSLISCNNQDPEEEPTIEPSNPYIDFETYPNDKILLGKYGDFLTSINGNYSKKELAEELKSMNEDVIGKRNDIFQTSYKKGLLDLFNINNNIKISMSTSTNELKKINEYHEKNNEESYRVCDLDIQINDLLFHYEDVGFRLKGNTSRGLVLNNDNTINQRHYKLCFNECFDDEYRTDSYSFKDENEPIYREDRTFFGLEKLDIRWNKNKESTYIREYYAFETYRNNGNLAPRSNPFNFEMNIDNTIHNAGIYLAVEPIDKDFIKRNIIENHATGDLYKLGWANNNSARFDSIDPSLFGVEKQYKTNNGYYVEKFVYDLKTNKKTSKHNDIKDFIAKVSYINTSEYYEMLKENTYYDAFIKYLSISYLMGDPDDLRGNYNNTYVYFIPYEDGISKAYFIPTDHDRVLGQTGDEGGNPTGHHSTLNNPFDNNTGYCNVNTMPLFEKSIFENGNDNVKEDYIKSINSIIKNGWFDIEKFISYYLIASNHFSDKIVLSDKFTNEDIKFSLKENNDIYSNENLSVDIYIATKLKNYSEYKSKDSE